MVSICVSELCHFDHRPQLAVPIVMYCLSMFLIIATELPTTDESFNGKYLCL